MLVSKFNNRFHRRNGSSPHKAFPPWKIAFYGSDDFSLVTLKALNENRLGIVSENVVESLDVICPMGNNIVNKYATETNLKIRYWPDVLPEDIYHVGVVVSFGHLIQTKSINACTYGMINAHPSLLPRWRGAAPIVHTILNGDDITGVTILQISPKKFDRGKILLQEEYKIPSRCTMINLRTHLAQKAAKMVLSTLKHLPNLLNQSKPQSNIGATHAFKIDSSMGFIDWNKMTCQTIDRHYRALSDLISLSSNWEGKTIKLKEFIYVNEELSVHENVAPGFCYYNKKLKCLCIKCQDGWVGFESIKIPGKKTMTALDFHNGFLSKRDEKNWYLES